jgi:hypothetical protein
MEGIVMLHPNHRRTRARAVALQASFGGSAQLGLRIAAFLLLSAITAALMALPYVSIR